MNKVLNKMGVIALAACAFATTACDDDQGVNPGAEASLSFTASGGASVLGDPMPPQNPITVAGHVIAISSVQLQLSELEVEGDDSAKLEMRGSMIQVALPVNGTVVTPITATLAPGTYTELEMKVQTVRIQGTYDGQPFDVSVVINEDLETEIRPPLIKTETSPANLTVVVDISGWFRNPDGSAIDLRSMTVASTERLATNIEISFDAFEDDDRSGSSHDD